MNSSPGVPKEDLSLANEWDIERIEKPAAQAGVDVEIKPFVRGNSAVTVIEMLVSERQVSLVVIGPPRSSCRRAASTRSVCV